MNEIRIVLEESDGTPITRVDGNSQYFSDSPPSRTAGTYEKRNGYGSSTLPTWHFTMPASAGSPEDLEIMLRDGYDAEARGTEESEGHQYVWVEYQMADEAAQQWYSVYPNIGARRVGSRRTAGASSFALGEWECR